MTIQSINKLSSNTDGFLLIVEGGRIDHAHHKNNAKKAMIETVELERAVIEALKMVNTEETLVIVTADHSHAVTINGYPDRGNSILGTWMDEKWKYFVSLNRTHPQPRPMTTIAYTNGPGFSYHYNTSTGFWRDLASVDTANDDFQQMATFYLNDETHGGEDVPLYAVGPQAHLLSGVHEQNYIAHVVKYAACLQPGTCPLSSSATLVMSTLVTISVSFFTLFCI